MQGRGLCLLVSRLVSVHSVCVFQSVEKDIMTRNDIAEKLRQEVILLQLPLFSSH